MDKAEIINKTKECVKSKQQGESTGHDWWHTYRVCELARKIGQIEQADLFIIELAALLHDLDDYKFNNDTESDQAEKILLDLGIEENIIKEVNQIIKDLAFKGAKVATPMASLEGKIVQDADRLDALGAIGIARAFAYGGYKGSEIYNPQIKPQLHQSFEEYKKSRGTTINHFYEKLFLLKDLMNTDSAKAIAKEKHEYMEEFVDEFLREWEGK